MLLNELFEPKNLVRLVGLTSRLQHQQEHGRHKKAEWTLEKFMNYLQDNGVSLDQRDFLKVIADKKGPLSNVITGVEDGKIKWYNEHEDDSDAKTQVKQQKKNDDIVSGLAKKAMK